MKGGEILMQGKERGKLEVNPNASGCGLSYDSVNMLARQTC